MRGNSQENLDENGHQQMAVEPAPQFHPSPEVAPVTNPASGVKPLLLTQGPLAALPMTGSQGPRVPEGRIISSLATATASGPNEMGSPVDGAAAVMTLNAPGPRQVMSPNVDYGSMAAAETNGPPERFNMTEGDGDVPMWEPTDWFILREQRVQREIHHIPAGIMESLYGMVNQSDANLGHLRSNMEQLADMCIQRTQVLAESVCEITNANEMLVSTLAQHFSAINETVGQVQVLTQSDRQMKSSMEQDGWIDR